MCDRYVVGEIQGYDVIYIPEKDIVFCKNTAIKLSVLDKAVKSHTISSTIEEKNLTITKDNGTLCLDGRNYSRKQEFSVRTESKSV